MRRSCIRELKRVVKQFFETEYWYRWRIKGKSSWVGTDGKKYHETTYNAFTLANTWDGDYPIFNLLDIKLSHMLYNLRRWADESGSYIDSGAVLAYGSDEDKKYIYNKLIGSFTSDNYFSDLVKVKDVSEKVYNKKAVKDGAVFKYAYGVLSDAAYLINIREFNGYDLGGEQSLWFVTSLTSSNADDDLRVGTFKSFEKRFEKLKFTPIINPSLQVISKLTDLSIEDIIGSHHTFDIPVIEYKKLSPELLKHMRGKRMKLHSLWQFRKMLRGYRDFSNDLMNDELLYTDALTGVEDLAERYKKFDEITENEIRAKQKDYLRKVVDYFVEESDRWVD